MTRVIFIAQEEGGYAAAANERLDRVIAHYGLALAGVGRASFQRILSSMDKAFTAAMDGTWPFYFWEN